MRSQLIPTLTQEDESKKERNKKYIYLFFSQQIIVVQVVESPASQLGSRALWDPVGQWLYTFTHQETVLCFLACVFLMWSYILYILFISDLMVWTLLTLKEEIQCHIYTVSRN